MRRFANATCAEELPGKAEHRATRLGPFTGLVNQRWNEGVTSAGAVTAELRALGFKGDAQAVRRYLKPFRLPGTSRSHPGPHQRKAAPAAPAVPKPRKISKALLTRPGHLTGDDALIVKNATAGCAHYVIADTVDSGRAHHSVFDITVLSTGPGRPPAPCPA